MSKIGKMPIAIPAWVDVSLVDNTVHVKWPKGELSYTLVQGVVVKIEEWTVHVSVVSEDHRNLWGLTRTLISNMVEGVVNGYEKKLLVIGVGFNAKLQGTKLVMQLGFSHPVEYEVPANISASVDKDPKGNNIVTIQGIDKQLVGEVAAKIRSFKKPEPYKGKGIRYSNEIVKLKPGKAAK